MKKKGTFDFIVFILVLGLIFFSVKEMDINPDVSVESSASMQERDYVNQYCSGQVEYRLPDKTRIDCLTRKYAIEFDYATKWAESIGQSLYYAKQTGKKPAVAIILKKESDKKYIKRINDLELGIKVFEICAQNYTGRNKKECNSNPVVD